jgi:hypothetical protein
VERKNSLNFFLLEYLKKKPFLFLQREVELSKDGWIPMFPQPVSPPVTSDSVASSNVNGNVGRSSFVHSSVAKSTKEEDSDFVNYDYGSSEDEASVVVRPYEVPSQVPKSFMYMMLFLCVRMCVGV